MTQMSPKEKASVREVIEKGYELKVERDKEAKKQKKVDALVSLVGKAK